MSKEKTIFKIVTSKVAAQVIRIKYGYNFELNKSIHKDFMKSLFLPEQLSTRLTDKEGEICFQSVSKIQLSKKVGVHFHEAVLNEMALFVQAQIEVGVKITPAINNWYEKYNLTDDVFQLDTAKKHFYRFREKEDKRLEIVEIYKKMHNNDRLWRNEKKINVPSLFRHRLPFFFSFLKDFDNAISVFENTFDKQVFNIISNKKIKANVQHKKLLAFLLHHSFKMTHRDIGTYFNVHHSTVQFYLNDIEKNQDYFIEDLYLIFQNVIDTFEDDRFQIKNLFDATL